MGLTPEQIKKRAEFMKQLKITKFTERKPYVFISYASDNWEQVFKECVLPLQKDHGLRVYADTAFDNVNNQWIVPMQRNLRHAKAMLAFFSQSYIGSYACFLELMMAVWAGIPIVFIMLNDSELDWDPNTDEFGIEDSVKDAIMVNGNNIIDQTDYHSDGFRIAMKSAYTLIRQEVKENRLSRYAVSEAFLNFLKFAPINHKRIDDLEKIKESIRSITTVRDAVFDSDMISEFAQRAAFAEETPEEMVSVIQETQPEPVHAPVHPVQAPVHPVSEVKPETPADPEPDELEGISDTAVPGSTSAGPAASKSGTKLTYTLFGSTKTSSQSEMMYDVFGTVLERFPDKYNDILSLNCVSDTDLSLKTIMDKKAQFNSCRTFRTAEGRILCVGAGYSINDKLRHIARLLNICSLDSSVLTIEGYELPLISADAPAGDTGRAGRNGSVLDYTIFGEQKTGTQGDIMYDIFEQALKRYPEKYDDMLSLNCTADTDYTKDSSEGKAQFRACKTFYTADGRVFCVGTSYGMDAKLRQIAKMMAICGIDRSQLVIDGCELPEKVSAASGEASDRSIASGTGISYELYGEHMNCQNQSEMMIQVFENVISRHLDKISEILELGCVSETDYSHEKKSGADFPSQFRAGKLIAAGERSVYIGTAYSLNAKYKLIKQLLSICGEPADIFNVTVI